MNFDLKKPCAECPFIKSNKYYFSKSRSKEIIKATSFTCHKTSNLKIKQSCAGRMILLERENKPDQMMRVAERLNLYDRNNLEINNENVFDTIQEFIDHNLTG